jgi:hypothetical protein
MMMIALLLQAAQPAPAATALPDIQLDFSASARRVVVENKGQVDLTIRTAVNGQAGEQNVVDVQAPELPQGRRELNDVNVRVRAEARIPAPGTVPEEQEPTEPR